MSKIHELAFNAEEIDELLDSVDKKTIYQDATQSERGLMSATDKTKLDALPTAQQIEGSLSEKVDKVEGKGLSTNDYTDAEKESVASAYHKPQNGIPKTDFDSSVQTSLNKADTALQSFTETDPTVPSWAKQSAKPSYDYSEIGNTPDLSGFITKSVNDLTNYYLKSETYTKAEVAALIGAIQQFHYEIYATLPQTGQGNVLYLIGPTGSGSDKYEEYVYANNTWNKIGDTSIDLSGYVTTSALNTALADYTTTSNLTILLAGKADKVITPSVLTVTEITQLTYTQVEALRQGDIVSASDLAYYVNFKTGSDCYLSSYDGNDLFFCLYYKEDNAWVNDGVSSVNLYSKADKVQFATPNNFAALNAEGNIVDSGSKASDFASASQGAKADTAYQKPPSGIPKSDLDSSVQTSLNKADIVVEVDEVTAAALNYLNERINGIVEALTRGLPSLRVEELTVARTLNAYIAGGNFYLNGEGAPTIPPQFNGQEYFDETNKVWYKASFTGTEPTAAAWKLITNA